MILPEYSKGAFIEGMLMLSLQGSMEISRWGRMARTPDAKNIAFTKV